MERQKRVAAVHDISGVGRCSLAAALSILSASGIEVCALPTAVLSTHTGGFTGYTFRDLTEDLPAYIGHWQSLGLTFDGIYSGYLGSAEQIDMVCRLADVCAGPGCRLLVDPVMADNGEMYSPFTPSFAGHMRRLCARADIIVPNMTEAMLLLDQPYKEGPYTRPQIEEMLIRLSSLGPAQVVLTGVWLDEGELGAASFDRAVGRVDIALSPRVEGFFHGAGDVFASALMAALTLGFSLPRATRLAVDFTWGCVDRSSRAGTDPRFGVNFEAGLPGLMRSLSLI